ncbi:MAG: hypothetical protein IPJ84_10140 [Bdellovibrionales bacterium]|nr:hypothetical protein [Bdellovibrionales bacterium]
MKLNSSRFLITAISLITSLLANQALAAESTDEQLLERRVQFAWESARNLIKACTFSDECALSQEHTSFARQIVLNESSYSAASLQFTDEASNPGAFSSVDGDPHRLMMTGLSPDAPIRINRARVKDLNVETLIGLFSHELVHHLGVEDDAGRTPDQFGAQMLGLTRSNLVPINTGLKETSMFILNFPQPIQPGFSKAYPKGLFPIIAIEQPGQILIQPLWMLEREGQKICAADEKIWSSSGLATGVKRSSTQVNVSFRLISRCFKESESALREVITYGATDLEYDTLRADSVKSAIVSFSLHPTDPDVTAYLDIEITSLPSTAKAGEFVHFSAKVESPTALKVIGCGALVGNKTWTDDATRDPLTLTTHDCRITRSTSETEYEIEGQFQVPTGVADGLSIDLAAVGLKLSNGNYLRGIPRQTASIKLSNPQPAPAISRLETRILDAKPLDPNKYPNAYYISQGATFRFEIRLPGIQAENLIDGFFVYQAQMLDKSIMTGTTSFDRSEMNCARTPDLTCAVTVDIARLNPTMEAVMWAPTHVVVLTSDFQFKVFDISLDAYAVVANVPAGGRP